MRQNQYNRDLAAGISTVPPRRNMVGRFGKPLLLVFVLATAVIAGRTMTLVVSGKAFGTGISRDQAIAVARSYDADAGTLVAARVGRLREFEGDGSMPGHDDDPVWAVFFRDGAYPVPSCGPAFPPGQRRKCPPPASSMLIVLDYHNGRLFYEETPSPMR